MGFLHPKKENASGPAFSTGNHSVDFQSPCFLLILQPSEYLPLRMGTLSEREEKRPEMSSGNSLRCNSLPEIPGKWSRQSVKNWSILSPFIRFNLRKEVLPSYQRQLKEAEKKSLPLSRRFTLKH
jgi:hypothetical protein